LSGGEGNFGISGFGQGGLADPADPAARCKTLMFLMCHAPCGILSS